MTLESKYDSRVAINYRRGFKILSTGPLIYCKAQRNIGQLMYGLLLGCSKKVS